jgi:putative endonuclease
MRRRARESAGRAAETLAALALRLRGFRILARRFATPFGEIDLVARRGQLLVFVEVKRRPLLAEAAAALTPYQQARIARAAGLFLQRHPQARACAMRFDVIALAPWRWPLHIRDVWRE